MVEQLYVVTPVNSAIEKVGALPFVHSAAIGVAANAIATTNPLAVAAADKLNLCSRFSDLLSPHPWALAIRLQMGATNMEWIWGGVPRILDNSENAEAASAPERRIMRAGVKAATALPAICKKKNLEPVLKHDAIELRGSSVSRTSG